MVGDEDQSIYGFRAAYPQALLNFEKIYKNSKVLLMETNYRSTPEILNVANQFIKQNKNRKNKEIVPFRKKGKNIQLLKLKSIEEQYNYILKTAKNIKKNETMAILYRNNDSAIPIVNMLNKNRIDFTIKESDYSFFDHYIVSDIKDFINFYIDQNNIELFKKIYYKINCGISKKHMDRLEKRLLQQGNSNALSGLIYLNETVFWKRKKLKKIQNELISWKKKSSYKILKSIFEDLEYKIYLKKKKADSSNNLQKISALYSLSKQNHKIKDFLECLNKLEQDTKFGKHSGSNLVLSTIHASKGLEYDRVLIIDAIDGIIPCVDKVEDEKDESFMQYEEEVRLFYVALTRAKTDLEVITYKERYGEKVEFSKFTENLI